MAYYVTKVHGIKICDKYENDADLIGVYTTKNEAELQAKIARINEPYNSRYIFRVMDGDQVSRNYKVEA